MSPAFEPNVVQCHQRRGSRREPGFLAITLAVVGATAGAVALVRGMAGGGTAWSSPHLFALLGGAVLCGMGLLLLQRGLRRRARLRAIADLMPHYRNRMGYAQGASVAAASSRRFSAMDEWEQEAADWGSDDRADLPLARAEMRAATRALLVSLEDELRHEAGSHHHRRSARPACRRARLRAAGRDSLGQRRHVVARSVRNPS